MCGILACFNYGGDTKQLRKLMLNLSKRIRHRGPDWTGIEVYGNNAMVHERLSIVDVNNGNQPLKSCCPNVFPYVVTIANGEIYNHKQLRSTLNNNHVFKTESDCEIIIHLYEEFGIETPKYLDGDFAFVLFDGENYFAARDPVGVVPLYQGWSSDGSIWFASEMKCIMDQCERIILFPPGHSYCSKTHELAQWYNPVWYDSQLVPRNPVNYELLRTTFKNAIAKRLMSDVPYGVLLSGGLDSSLVASVISRIFRDDFMQYSAQQTKISQLSGETGSYGAVENKSGFKPALHSFAIGLIGSPDLKAAKEVADFLGTIHHEFHFTVDEGIDAISDVIHHVETYNVPTIQASTAMYLLARKIKALGIKVVLSGEGADELFGGYLYFHHAPNSQEFHKECVARVKHLHYKGCLRANKSTMAWGVEIRVPFLDREFMDLALSLDPHEKECGNRIEKHILRKAFDDPIDPYLPSHILWRQKEQFNDGVGYAWADGLKSSAESEVTNEEMQNSYNLFPDDTPSTKEAFLYRKIFHSVFSNPACRSTIKRWSPPESWGCNKESDVTGRAQSIHVSVTKKVNADPIDFTGNC